MDTSANDPSQNWDNDKTEVYMDSDEDEAAASLIDADGDVHPITAFPYVLGRGTECDLVLNGKGLSRKHVEIIFQSGRFVINDLDSLNGLKVNGYKVSRVILEEGDAIKLGEVHLTFTSGESELSPDGDAIAPAIPGSDPFRADGSKKFLKLGAGALSVVLILGGVIFGYQSMQAPQPAGKIVQTQQPTVVTPPAQEIAPALARPSITAPPRAISAPPPSISMVSDIPARKPKIVEKASIVAKVAPKPKPYKNLTKAKKLLAGANARYLDGDADELFRDMNKLEN
ncbi:MAG: FHA domain-containing protein, partial [Flavobacteriales bacterium]|nr:FHA domain-containing protein [Flavobacteriales bacterium]